MTPWRTQWHPTPVLLPGKPHGQRSLVGCSPWGRWESDMTERFHFHFSLSCIGEGNGNPLQCSCLENPRDGGAWWAAVYGVAQSRTWLKRLSSSSSSVTPKSVLIVSMVTCHQLIALSSASRKTLSTVLSPILLQKTLQITSYPQKAPQDFPISPVSSTISPSFNPMFYSYWTTHNSLT